MNVPTQASQVHTYVLALASVVFFLGFEHFLLHLLHPLPFLAITTLFYLSTLPMLVPSNTLIQEWPILPYRFWCLLVTKLSFNCLLLIWYNSHSTAFRCTKVLIQLLSVVPKLSYNCPLLYRFIKAFIQLPSIVLKLSCNYLHWPN